MNSDSKQPEDAQPDATSKDALMEKFRGVIDSYADAINADDQERADQAAMSALMLAAMETVERPSQYVLLAQKASEHLIAGNWQDAEDTYRELIAVQEQTAHPGQTTKAIMDLSRLFYLLGRLDDAWLFAQTATESARVAEFSSLLAMALDHQATCSLAQGKPEEALAAAEEALRVIEPGKIRDLMRSMAHASRGRALLALGDAVKAEKDLEAAWSILRSKKQSRIGTGPVVAVARCFELEAELHVRQKRLPEALASIKQAIEQRRESVGRLMELSPHPTAAVAWDLERLAEIHRENGDTVAAEEALKQAAELREQIRLPARIEG